MIESTYLRVPGKSMLRESFRGDRLRIVASMPAQRPAAPHVFGDANGSGSAWFCHAESIDFPGTRKYVDSIIARYQFYRRRGRM